MKTKTESRSISARTDSGGFTLTELLVILGTIVVLALILTPALAATKPNSKAAQCLNDKRQLTLAWLMYASDNNDSLISYTTWIPLNSFMDWTTSSKNFDVDYLTNSAYAQIAAYNRNISVFKCPADDYESAAQIAANTGPRLRSISLNGALTGSGGAGPSVKGLTPDGGRYFGAGASGAGQCTKLGYLSKPGPANTFVFLDEQADSIDDGIFMFDPGISSTSEYWRNLPASYHNGAVGISFADGHAEMHKWLEMGGSSPSQKTRMTVYPVRFTTGYWGAGFTFSSSQDYAWMQAHMPYR